MVGVGEHSPSTAASGGCQGQKPAGGGSHRMVGSNTDMIGKELVRGPHVPRNTVTRMVIIRNSVIRIQSTTPLTILANIIFSPAPAAVGRPAILLSNSRGNRRLPPPPHQRSTSPVAGSVRCGRAPAQWWCCHDNRKSPPYRADLSVKSMPDLAVDPCQKGLASLAVSSGALKVAISPSITS